ncbi:MAG: hypothetical protein JWN52_7779 [Actinomycetia bacterium]|nr:hypothetical protein [Actinomycetes bacterium]
MIRIIADDALERSSVVANCAMNRERSLTGSNGYGRELGIDVLTVLLERFEHASAVRWLDLCCGTGRALLEAIARLNEHGVADRVEITGLDLVDHFAGPSRPPTLRLVTASVTGWTPADRFDLITSVHGLHYVGDKLGVLTRAASWLTDSGLFTANLDARSILLPDGTPAGRGLTAELRRQGFTYDPARRRISCQGHRTVHLPYRYLGADDQAGPNYTGQPAVHSLYAPNG